MPKEELVFGLHTVMALLESTPEYVSQLYTQKGREDQYLKKIITLALSQNISHQELTREKIDLLLPNCRHQGVIVKYHPVEKYTEPDIARLLSKLSEPPFLLILDGVQDPHNLGACLRSANAAGVHLVIAPQDRSVGLTPVARKVACGAAEITPFIQVTNLARTLRSLKEQGIWLYGAVAEAKTSIYQTDLQGALAMIVGAEGKGLRRLTAELCDYHVAIPLCGSVSSLNVSVAAGVCLFEVVRQRVKGYTEFKEKIKRH